MKSIFKTIVFLTMMIYSSVVFAADIKLSQLPAATSITGNDLLLMNDTNNLITKSISFSNFLASIISGTPSQYNFVIWNDATHVKGVAVAGTKVVCTDSNGQPTACASLTDIAIPTQASFSVDDLITLSGRPEGSVNLGTWTQSGTILTNDAETVKTALQKVLTDYESSKHSQNTDTGTTSATFQLASGSTGVKLKNNSGGVVARNSGDTANTSVTGLTLESTVATGTAPLTVASTTVVPNLNASLLSGNAASYFQAALTNPVTGTGTLYHLPVWSSASGIGAIAALGSVNAPLLSGGATANPAFAAYTLAVPGAVGAVLYSDGTNWTRNTAPVISAANMTSFPTLNQSTTGTATKAINLVGGNSTTLLGSIPYQSTTDTTTLLSPNTTTTRKFLRMTGTGTYGTVPVWDSDVASLGANTFTGTQALGANSITMTGSLGLAGARLTKGWFTDLEVTNPIAGSTTGNIANSVFNAKGDTIIGTADNNSAILAVGANYSIPYALDTETTGWKWVEGVANATLGWTSDGVLAAMTTHRHTDDAAQFYNLADSTKLHGIDVSGNSANVVGWFKPQVTVTGNKYIFPSISVDTYIPSGNVTLSGPTTTNRTITVPDANVTSPFEDRLVAYFNGGGTTAIVANEKVVIVVPFPCVITGGVITASKKLGTSGVVSAVVDIWKESTLADYDGGSSHPAVTDTIVGGGGTKPTVTADNSSLISVTGWATTTLAKGDILIFNADSITDTVIATVTLYVSRR